MTTTTIFKTDQGATYVCQQDAGVWVFSGTRVNVSYTSPDNRLVITGKKRNQGRMGGAFKFSVGQGHRGFLVLDTGEGVEKITGVVLA